MFCLSDVTLLECKRGGKWVECFSFMIHAAAAGMYLLRRALFIMSQRDVDAIYHCKKGREWERYTYTQLHVAGKEGGLGDDASLQYKTPLVKLRNSVWCTFLFQLRQVMQFAPFPIMTSVNRPTTYSRNLPRNRRGSLHSLDGLQSSLPRKNLESMSRSELLEAKERHERMLRHRYVTSTTLGG